ncbi:MAG: anhydro-N-acetylmuramic acid kinase [Verrucomicrobia bacterium]|nr:anhydro-N-acetylmuramic acid kinase [Verrucomicrobiota bacterium]
MTYVGVNVGALTVKLVALRGDDRQASVVAHQGRPLEVIEGLIAAGEFTGAAYCVSGPLGHISEVAAIQRALGEVAGEFDAVASLGGESFLVYLLAGGRITNVLSHNKCAAGSGEFFAQQIGRMGLGMEEAIRRSFAGKVVPLAARCSVHCKSDITHKLNRKEAAPEDILHTLHDSMASKVVALLEKGQRELRRVLVIGGVTRNAAMLAALREKLPATAFVVLPESPWFEAWGSALLAHDEPLHKAPKLARQSGLGHLPPLKRYADRVQVIAEAPRQAPPARPLVLGVDAGSTTTKATLLDPSTRGVVASHYTRTRGDPVTATRECLRSLADQVGNRPVGLVATTGSARELVGAYLGTEHVYNEISAQAAGAAHCDAEVDTIFEIGGQDSKYIYLRNGVPIDYAMNNACSAGTGSFLEESAQGDLGITVSEIADLALAAPSPVHFKATCAAFINSDIRIAQQQGHSRDNIVAGLVYAIAGNYLTKVKGQRCVGNKVFLQGGVALNRAVGHAFAHSVGRPVVIPPRPELLGALGVALLALGRSSGWPGVAPELLALAAPEMKLVSRFTCRACKLYCRIDRFEVAGRRFPFGGRCSLYENVWKRKSRTVPAPDLVEQRAELLFGVSAKPADPTCRPRAEAVSSSPREILSARARSEPEAAPIWTPAHCDPTISRGEQDPQVRRSTAAATLQQPRPRLGLPRALTTHSLFPLYSVFFSGLGMEVVLSGVDPRGELKSNSGFCFPAQIAHGAVLDLARQGVDLVFLPHLMRMPQANACRDSYLCPITQAGPHFLAKAFPDVRLLSPLLDFTHGYEASSALVELAVRELGIRRELADQAWTAAVRAQTEAERGLRELGQRALAQAVAEGKPAILLAGHSYNAFTPEASQSVGKKLASMGVTVIPADSLAPAAAGPTAWHFANQIMNAVSLAVQHPNLFLLCVSNFSCTIDAFTHAMLASELGAKPYLILEIDAHTADAGTQTRLEAFLDIVRNYREAPARRSQPFTACRLASRGQVIPSNGAPVPLADPRVKIYFPNFSPYHTQAGAMAVRWLGLHAGEVIPLDRGQLDKGLQYTSGRECLPLPICLGQILHIHEHRPPGEIAGFFMLRGGAPCVVDCYMGYFERFIAEQQLPDLFLLNPQQENDYCGFDKTTLVRHLSPAILVADIIVEIEQVLRVVGAPGSVEELRAEWQRFAAAAGSLDQFQAGLPAFVQRLAALPRTRDPLTCPRVVVTGDFFTRFSPFFMAGVPELYAERGIIFKPVDLSDLFLYAAYHDVAGAAHEWGMKPGGLAIAKACTRILQPDGKQYLQQWLTYQAERWSEEYYRWLFRGTGLLLAGPNDVSSLFEKAAEHVSPAIYGEVIPTVGKGLEAASEGYDGLILIGPFNCLPYRISEAILKPLSIQRRMPILTYESDGYAVPPSFLRQVEVHIQQVLESAARNREARALATGGLATFLKSAVGRLR